MAFTRRLTVFLLMLAALTVRVGAQQSSIVPATHSIYDWLFTQRVFGRLPDYNMEVRPTSRGVILGHLRKLSTDSARMSGTDRGLLRDFLNEFDFDRLLKNGLLKSIDLDLSDFPTSVVDALVTRKDPYIYSGRAADSSFSGALWASVGTGSAYDRGVSGRFPWLTFNSRSFRAFVDSKMGLGASVELNKSSNTGGNISLLGLDPQLDGDWKYRALRGNISVRGLDPQLDGDSKYRTFQGDEAAYHTEAWVSYMTKYVTLDYGTGAASYGPAVTDAIVLRANAPNIVQFRAQVGTHKLSYLFAHGSLATPPLANSDTITTYDGRRSIVPQKPQRWMAMHRITWNPTPKWTLSGHELIVYGGRSVDPLYLIPVLPQEGQIHTGDAGNTDNGNIGADIIYRPRAGTELFFSVLIDHLIDGNPKYLLNVLHSDYRVKQILSLGAEQRLPGDLRLGVGYLRADPYAYTHWNLLSAWQVEGRPLGAAIGPNSDELSVRLTRWFPFRTRVMVGGRRIRNGLNPVDAKGNQIRDVGGDLLTNNEDVGNFMQGADIQAYNRFEFEIESEPIRGVKVTWNRAVAKSYQGSRIPPYEGTSFFRISFGF